MILDSFNEIDTNKYSVVIWYWPAGLSLALELEKHDISSLILEAGRKILVRNHNHFIK